LNRDAIDQLIAASLAIEAEAIITTRQSALFSESAFVVLSFGRRLLEYAGLGFRLHD